MVPRARSLRRPSGLALRQANALGVGKAPGFTSELIQEDSIFLLQILDDRLLVAVNPAGDHKKQHLDLCIHPRQKTVPLRTTQAPRPRRRDKLALHAGIRLPVTNLPPDLSNNCERDKVVKDTENDKRCHRSV
jgi:hypothetical protein